MGHDAALPKKRLQLFARSRLTNAKLPEMWFEGDKYHRYLLANPVFSQRDVQSQSQLIGATDVTGTLSRSQNERPRIRRKLTQHCAGLSCRIFTHDPTGCSQFARQSGNGHTIRVSTGSDYEPVVLQLPPIYFHRLIHR